MANVTVTLDDAVDVAYCPDNPICEIRDRPCFFPDCPQIGSTPQRQANCRELEGGRKLATCVYPVSAINSAEDYDTFRRTFIVAPGATVAAQNQVDLNRLMTNFCTQVVTTCPSSEIAEFNACSRFVSTDPSGSACRQWAANNPNAADAAKISYCNNQDTPDCLCLFPTLSPTGQALANSVINLQGAPKACWWRPCTEDQFLTTEDIRAGGRNCPDVCQSIIAVANQGEVNVGDVRTTVTCDLSGVVDDDGDDGDDDGKTGKGGDGNDQGNGFPWLWLIIGGLVLVGLIILVIVLTRR